MAGSGALGGTPVAQAEPAWTCDAFGYLFQSPSGDAGPHDIFQIDLATGESTHYASMSHWVNGVAYNPLDNYFYAWSGAGEFVRINADGTHDSLGLPAGVNPAGYNVGDMDSSGHLWVTRSINGEAYYEIDYAPGSPTYGQVVSQGTVTFPAGLANIGADWSWIDGYLYSVGSEASGVAHLVRFDPATDTATDMGALPISSGAFGATYADADGNLWASDNVTGAIYRIDPANLQTVKVSDGPISGGNDGARCASAPIPTITVTKEVPARVQAADQFTVGVRDSGGALLTSATTTGADTTVSTTNWPVSQGRTYTITDAMAPGSPDALSAYVPTIECVDGNGSPVETGGTAASWTITVSGTTDYQCTVTNTPGEPSFEVEKTADTEGPVAPGDTVTYTVTAANTGTVPYTAENPASFTDDLSGVLDDATYNGDATNGATVDGTTLDWSGPLGVGETVTVTYSVTVDDPAEGDKELSNVVIGGENCPEGSTAAECSPPDVPVLSYETVKTVDATRVEPGQKVTYTVTVTNTGKAGYTAENPASFTDDLSKVLDDATYNGDASNGATVDGSTLSWSGPLAIGETVTITYSFTVNDPDEGDQQLSNAVVTPANVGGNCPEGTDNPDCVTEVPGTKLDVEKSASAEVAVPGDTVTYSVTVTNTGKADFTEQDPASFTDDLSKVLDDATYNGDASNGATVDGSTLSWSGPLAVGETVTITYSVTVDSPPSGDRVLDNVVTTPPGMNGNCGEGSTDPKCGTHTDVRSFEVVKKASASEAAPGEKVTYTVTVTNTGQVPYTEDEPASFTDDLSKVLDDATYNGDADNGATVEGSTLSWSGPLDLGESVTITYSVTVNDPVSGDGNLHNVVTTPPGSGGEETGGNCPEGSDNADCSTDTSVKEPTPPGANPQEPGDKGGSGIKPVGKPSGSLASTGADMQLVMILAGLLMLAGTTLLLVSRHRRGNAGQPE
ncbi:LPXTG cell wall anchor domain-containing protein [Prauserella sp. PE36]|uniref:DUF7927 domain-containing protein n=1 Tax=Prauserella sp. PE36 TaxID=1504709 RepID=UPI0013140AE9|nr:LPXTG cell wall anchor domain-containing protein [Prauserella sp. PE36]